MADTDAELKRAEEHKAKGNALFSQERFAEAAEEYSAAIDITPENHILHANRAACYAQKGIGRYAEALVDATHCIELAPSWGKGYARKAQAECLLERFADAEATCRKGMALEQVKGDAKQAAMLRTQLQALRDAGHRTDIEEDRSIVNVEEAQREKAVGNSDFQGKRWGDAVVHFTSALEFDPTDHILWSNRSAAFAEQDEFANALRDAQYCVFLKPDWAKGYSRLALALYNLGRYPECLQAVEGGLKLDPENSVLKPMMEGLKLDVAETPAVQKGLHDMRADAKRQDKMLKVLNGIPGLNMSNVNINGMGGGFGGFGGLNMGGLNLGGATNKMTDAQMRAMARALNSPGGFSNTPTDGGTFMNRQDDSDGEGADAAAQASGP